MNFHTLHFGDNPKYKRMVDVLAYSMKVNSPQTPLIIHTPDITPDEIGNFKGKSNYVDSFLKTKHQSLILNQLEDGEVVGFLDCDMFVLHDLFYAEHVLEGFDFGYTVRPGSWPFNSGVTFVKVSNRTKSFYQQWVINVNLLLEKTELRKKYELKFGRLNQCGLARLLETHHGLQIQQFPCEIWNCVPQTYKKFDQEKTKIVHILAKLRELTIRRSNGVGATTKEKEMAATWKQLENQMQLRYSSAEH